MFRPEGLYDETQHGGEKGMRPRTSVVPMEDAEAPNPKTMQMDRDMGREDTAHGAMSSF